MRFTDVTRRGWLGAMGGAVAALAHVSALMLMIKFDVLRWITRSFGAIGQLALSNYLMHSVICSTIFCGYGFGLYGQLQRYQLYYVVGSIWIVQMIISPIWLKHFHFGPAEWVWRSLTYWKKQPMRKMALVERVSEVA